MAAIGLRLDFDAVRLRRLRRRRQVTVIGFGGCWRWRSFRTARPVWKPGAWSGWIVRFHATGCTVSTLVAPTSTLVAQTALPTVQHSGRPVG